MICSEVYQIKILLLSSGINYVWSLHERSSVYAVIFECPTYLQEHLEQEHWQEKPFV